MVPDSSAKQGDTVVFRWHLGKIDRLAAMPKQHPKTAIETGSASLKAEQQRTLKLLNSVLMKISILFA